MQHSAFVPAFSRIARLGLLRIPVIAALLTLSGAQTLPAQQATTSTPATGVLAGRVIDAHTRAPQGAVIIELVGARRGTQSDEQGAWRLDNVAPGRYVLRARRLGLDSVTRTIDVVSGRTDTIELAIRERAAVVAPVVVSATREQQRRTENSVTVDVLDGEQLRLARASHPAQVMKRIPGVYVSQLSGEGHSMAIRQPITTKPMYLYLEDGVPTRATGFFNHNALYEVNLPQSGGLEVLKGPGTALYGSDAIGGVVNALTRPAPTTPSADITLEGGRYGYERALVTGGTTVGRHGIRADLNLTAMTGWRENAPYNRQSGTVRWDAALRDGLTVRTVVTTSYIRQNDVLAQDSSQFVNRSPINRSPIAFRRVEALRWSTAIEGTSGSALWSITPFARRDVLRLLPSWQLTFDPQVWDTRNTSAGMLLRFRRDYVPMHARVIAGADIDLSPGSFTADRAVLTTSGTGTARLFSTYTVGARHYDYDVTFRQTSPYVHGEFSPLSRVRFDAGVRYDAVGYRYSSNLAPLDTGAHRIPPSQTRTYTRVSPKTGVTIDLPHGLNAYASYRTGFRAPSHSQLFQQNTALNSVDLKPVTVGSSEIGMRGEHGVQLAWSIAAYDMTLRNDVITYVTPINTREATNAGSTRHRGVEGSAGVKLARTLRLDVAASVSRQRYVTWVPQAARAATATAAAVKEVRYDGNRIEQAPDELGNMLLTWTPKLLKGGRFAGEWTHTGRYAMDPANTRSYSGYDVFALHANAFIRPGLELFGRVVNLTDRTYAELAAYDGSQGLQYTPGTPRSLYVGARYSWER